MKPILTMVCGAMLLSGCSRHREDTGAELRHRYDECAYLLPVIERRVELLKSQTDQLQVSLVASGATNRSDFTAYDRAVAQLEEATQFRDILESRMMQLKISGNVERKSTPNNTVVDSLAPRRGSASTP